tara:strand:- start:14266 stop:15339 length:1074 start_codon:yes stop_codon:yes gene_type:complete
VAAKRLNLTDEQKMFLQDNFEEFPDLNELTKKCFEDDALDGRSKEGRAVRAFLQNEGLEYKTTQHEKVEGIELSESQKTFILMQMEDSGLSSVAIANLLFERKLTPLSKETREVLAFMRENDPEYNSDIEEAAGIKYSPPQALSRIIKKIKDFAGIEIDEEKMNRNTRFCLEKLKINLNNKRFILIMSNTTLNSDRELLESEFIRLTWDKPDLTADEVSLYINLAKEFVILETCSKHIEKLKEEFDKVTGTDKEGKLSVTLSEIIKTKGDEYHKSSSRIESLIKKLQGDRASRIKDAHKTNATILSLVQAFQEKSERDVMLDIANKQREAIEEEINAMETMDSFKCRILGIGKSDVL